jgi:exodeoxyribonuclease VII large subunit
LARDAYYILYFHFLVKFPFRNPSNVFASGAEGGIVAASRYNGTAMERDGAQRIYSVGEVNRLANNLLQGLVLRVEGEVSNLRSYPAYTFFSLADGDVVLPCAVFGENRQELPPGLCEGMSLLARGRLGIYARKGQYRMSVLEAQEWGEGRLRREFLQLMRKLSREGLFDQALKKQLPEYPEKIGLITSLEGAAVRDVAINMIRRFPAARLIIRGVRVQGEQALPDIVSAIECFNRAFPVDVLLLARGGGSLEDLHPFNSEAVVRAIRASKIPVVTGIGHEPDLTLADLAADFRASTPTGAAEAVVPSSLDAISILHAMGLSLRAHTTRWLNQLETDLRLKERTRIFSEPSVMLEQPAQQLADYGLELDRRLRALVAGFASRLHECAGCLARYPRQYRALPSRISEGSSKLRAALNAWWRWHDAQPALCKRELDAAARALLDREEAGMRIAASKLEALSPLAVLGRGYSIATRPGGGKPLTDSAEVREGEDIEVRLHRGRLGCQVKNKPA